MQLYWINLKKEDHLRDLGKNESGLLCGFEIDLSCPNPVIHVRGNGKELSGFAKARNFLTAGATVNSESLKHSSSHLLRISWTPEHGSSSLFTNHFVAPYWIASSVSVSSSHSCISDLPPTARSV
jgi:hypothetical protein